MKFSAKVAHEARNNLEYLLDIAVNPLNTEWIFLSSGIVIVGNIMEKKGEQIFTKFNEMMGTTQNIIS